MLRSSTGPRPASSALRSGAKHSCLRAAVAILALAVPTLLYSSLAAAASVTLDLVDDASGLGASVVIDDGVVPGNLSLSIESTSEGGLVPDLLGFQILDGLDDFAPGLGASGADVALFRIIYETQFVGEDGVKVQECPCGLTVDLGTPELWELTGITSTDVEVSHPSLPITLETIAGSSIRLFLAVEDSMGPGSEDGFRLIKPVGIVPEPSTALLMMLGLAGLSRGARRFA